MPNIYAGVAGISLIEEAGVPAIEEHVTGLGDAADRRAPGSRRDGGDTAATRRAAGRSSACARPTWTLSSESSTRTHIVASSRDDNLRVALHLYNTAEDVDVVLAALRARRHLLA